MKKVEILKELREMSEKTIVNKELRHILVDYCQKEIDRLEKKSTKSPEVKKDLQDLQSLIKDALLQEQKGLTVSDLLLTSQLENFTLSDGRRLTNQKLTSVLTLLVKGGTLQREVIKKKAIYSLIK